MARLKLEMDLGNAALQDEAGYISHEAIARVLRDVADQIQESYAILWTLYDDNGNTVGVACIEEEE